MEANAKAHLGATKWPVHGTQPVHQTERTASPIYQDHHLASKLSFRTSLFRPGRNSCLLNHPGCRIRRRKVGTLEWGNGRAGNNPQQATENVALPSQIQSLGGTHSLVNKNYGSV